MPEHIEKQLSTETVFSGKVFDITLDQIRLENGDVTRREVVHHNGGAGVVALNSKGEVALVRQYRYAVGREMVEIPAGKIEKGEAPRTCAIRELEEEAGCRAASVVDFGQVVPTCAYCTEVIYLFLATGLTKTAQHLDLDEFLDVFWLPLSEACAMVCRGEIDDSKTVAGLLKAKLLWNAGELAV